MSADFRDYSTFFRFVETYSSSGFKGVNRNDPLITEIEDLTEGNKQFFYVGDILQMHIIFSSTRCFQMLGIAPEELTPYHFFEATHPDDMFRHTLGRAQLFKIAHELFRAEKGEALLSTNIRLRNPQGKYSDTLLQLYFYYSTIPYKSVFVIKVHTNIDWFTGRKHGFHYYVGNNMSYFRYPDEKLLMTGIPYSDREFEIIKLIETGLGSDQIAKKLFLSVHTVNTHRRNIIEKANKQSISDVIYDLMERGVL